MRIRDREDDLRWAPSPSGKYTLKFGYAFLMAKKSDVFLVYAQQYAKTEEVRARALPSLQTRFGNSPSPVHRLSFLQSGLGRSMSISGKFQRWEGRSVVDAWEVWWQESLEENWKALPLLIFWGIWLARNWVIFNEQET